MGNAGASGGLAFSVLATLPSINIGSLTAIANFTSATCCARVIVTLWLSGMILSYAADWAGVEISQVGHSAEVLPEWYMGCSRWVVGLITVVSVVRRVLYRSGDCCKPGKECKAE